MTTLTPKNDRETKHPIYAVIFDLDGTLVDSNLDFSAIKAQLNVPDQCDILTHIAALPDAQQTAANAYVLEQELLDAQQCHWIVGAKALLNQLNQLGQPVAIVTRNSQVATQIKMTRHQIPVTTVLTREDARPKPDPEALLAIAQQWKIDPQHCMYVGDYRYDLEAAANAGMPSCLFVGAKPTAQLDAPYARMADVVCQSYDQFYEVLNEAKFRLTKPNTTEATL